MDPNPHARRLLAVTVVALLGGWYVWHAWHREDPSTPPSMPCAAYFAKPVPNDVDGCIGGNPLAPASVEVTYHNGGRPYDLHCWIVNHHYGDVGGQWTPFSDPQSDPCGLNEVLNLPNSCPHDPAYCQNNAN